MMVGKFGYSHHFVWNANNDGGCIFVANEYGHPMQQGSCHSDDCAV